jgi:hypothetical protein
MTRPDASGLPERPSPSRAVPGQAESGEDQRAPGVLRTILGRDRADDDLPLPDLPPLPADPRWRIEHLPMVTAAGIALVLCAASVGFVAGGRTAALGAAAGVLIVTLSFSMSTLAVAWADVIRPALVLPVGLLTYVIKYILIVFIMIGVAASGWPGGRPMAWGIAGGVVLLTAVQVWWVARLARRNWPGGRPGAP